MEKQITMFKDYVRKLQNFIGDDAVKKIIEEALVMISAGSNDLAISFYSSPARSGNVTIAQYHDYLLGKIENFIRVIYVQILMLFLASVTVCLCCRKFTVSGGENFSCGG